MSYWSSVQATARQGALLSIHAEILRQVLKVSGEISQDEMEDKFKIFWIMNFRKKRSSLERIKSRKIFLKWKLSNCCELFHSQRTMPWILFAFLFPWPFTKKSIVYTYRLAWGCGWSIPHNKSQFFSLLISIIL